MKRTFLSLFAAIAFGVCVMAQDNRVATLLHGSNIQAFYGGDALLAAHEAAVDGDIITLSIGEFNSCDITKAITLRGEGMFQTSLLSSITFTIPHGSTHTLTLEGLGFTHDDQRVRINGTDGTERAVISKCYFYQRNASLDLTNCNATIVQCRFYPSVNAEICAYKNSSVVCLNSILTTVNGYNNAHYDIQNCIVGSFGSKYSSIKNSIIKERTSLDATNTSSHCLVYQGSGFTNSWSVDSWDNIIEGGWNWWGLFHLTEEAAATYFGTDGTQVGIHGGMYPWDTTPDYPLVKRLDVIGSHKDGKLNVKINVE
jgi:hypothetical protein